LIYNTSEQIFYNTNNLAACTSLCCISWTPGVIFSAFGKLYVIWQKIR